MGVISAATIAKLRTVTETVGFHDTYVLKHDVNTPDDAGGWTTVVQDAEGGACDVVTGIARPDERAMGGRIQATAVYTISLPYITHATASDRIVVGTRTFEIIDVLKDGFLGTEARAICEERT